MESPYLDGVRYLSREEEAAIRRAREQRAELENIKLKLDDAESIQFMRNVNNGVQEWKDESNVWLHALIH